MLNELNERLANNSMGMVYEMHEIDDALDGEKATSILEKTKNNFNVTDSYFEFDGYGNIKSYSTIEEVLEMYDDIQ